MIFTVEIKKMNEGIQREDTYVIIQRIWESSVECRLLLTDYIPLND